MRALVSKLHSYGSEMERVELTMKAEGIPDHSHVFIVFPQFYSILLLNQLNLTYYVDSVQIELLHDD